MLRSEWAVKKHVQDGVTGTQRGWKELCTACAQQRGKDKAHLVSERWGLCFGQSEIWPGSGLHLWHVLAPCISPRQVAGIHQGLSLPSDGMASTMIWRWSCVNWDFLPSGDAFPLFPRVEILKSQITVRQENPKQVSVSVQRNPPACCLASSLTVKT